LPLRPAGGRHNAAAGRPGAGLGGAVMLAAAATVIVRGEYVRAVPPVAVLMLLAVVARAAL